MAPIFSSHDGAHCPHCLSDQITSLAPSNRKIGDGAWMQYCWTCDAPFAYDLDSEVSALMERS